MQAVLEKKIPAISKISRPGVQPSSLEDKSREEEGGGKEEGKVKEEEEGREEEEEKRRGYGGERRDLTF